MYTYFIGKCYMCISLVLCGQLVILLFEKQQLLVPMATVLPCGDDYLAER